LSAKSKERYFLWLNTIKRVARLNIVKSPVLIDNISNLISPNKVSQLLTAFSFAQRKRGKSVQIIISTTLLYQIMKVLRNQKKKYETKI
jgi:hypothetical protein